MFSDWSVESQWKSTGLTICQLTDNTNTHSHKTYIQTDKLYLYFLAFYNALWVENRNTIFPSIFHVFFHVHVLLSVCFVSQLS